MSEFVRATDLYDIESRAPIAHPAHQATDIDVHRALEDREFERTAVTPRADLIRAQEIVSEVGAENADDGNGVRRRLG